MGQLSTFQGHTTAAILAFMGAIFALLTGSVAIIYVLASPKIQFARVLILFMAAGIGLYIATLFGFSML